MKENKHRQSNLVMWKS